MFDITRTRITANLDSVGFQGFNPMTNAQAEKLSQATDGTSATEAFKESYQVAKFQSMAIVTKTDDDAGNGDAMNFDKPTITTQTIYVKSADLVEYTNLIIAGNPMVITFDEVGGLNKVTNLVTA